MLIKRLDVSSILAGRRFSPGRRFARPPTRCARTDLMGAVRRLKVKHPDACTPAVSLVLKEECVAGRNGGLCLARVNRIIGGVVGRSFPDVMSIRFATGVRNLLSVIRRKGIP